MPTSFPRLLVICSILPCISTFWLPCTRAFWLFPCRNDPTAAPTVTPTPLPTPTPTLSVSPTAPTESPTVSPTESNNDDDNDLFTIIFVSDIENQWRGHDIYRSQYVVKYIRDLRQQELYFDGDYSNVKIEPQLVVNGGDITHWWNCEATISSRLMNYFFPSETCRTPDKEFADIFGQLYEAGIPMISAYGNHDWRPKLGTGNYWAGTPQLERDEQVDQINAWSSEFTRETYVRSLNLGEGIGIDDYEEILPTGAYGQSMFRASFRGLQLASFNAAYNFQSYDINGTIYSSDNQLEQLAETLNRDQPTMFFSHFPLSSTRLQHPSPTVEQVKSLIREFPSGTHHFAGHYHAAVVESYTESLPHFKDYICPYPHIWDGREPGYLAVLANSREGILQVKPMTIPGLEDGAVCIPAPNDGDQLLSSQFLRQGFSNSSNSAEAEAMTENGCERCKRGAQYFSNDQGEWVCGQDPDNSIVSETEQEDLTGVYYGDSLDQEEW